MKKGLVNALVDAEPDEQQREDQEVAGAKDETLELEGPGASDEQPSDKEQEDQRCRGKRRLAPAPANRGRQQRKDEEQEERAGRAVG